MRAALKPIPIAGNSAGCSGRPDPSCQPARHAHIDGLAATSIELHLPYPPSVNHIWRKSRGHFHKSSEYTAWLKRAGDEILAQKPGGISGPYKLSMYAVRPDRRRRDLSNLLKATEDLLVSVGVIDDDCKAEMIVMRWVTSGDGVTVRVERAGVE